MVTDVKLAKQIIAKRVAKELKSGQLVNLGIGLPTLVANYVPKELEVTFQSENGMVGMGSILTQGHEDLHIINAGGQYVEVLPEGVFFDSSMSFALIRGGHVDVTVLGAFQVDESGNLANWIIPGKMVAGMGGAMDLVTGARKVIIAMQHTRNGKPKILKSCTIPLTARGEVDMIITELCVIQVTNKGLLLKEIHKETTIDEVKRLTEATLIIPDEVKTMEI